MSEQNSPESIESESSEWLDAALRIYGESGFLDFEAAEAAPPSTTFGLKCFAAADVALSIAKLRKERQRAAFAPLSLTQYISGLVKLAGIDFAPILAWLGVDELPPYEAKSAKTFARLAQAIGMSLRETLAHIRIGFANRLGTAPNSLVIAYGRHTADHRSVLQECEAALMKFESNYNIDNLRELRQIEFGIQEEYHTQGSASR
jgi:hypothetical protein